MKCVSIVYKRPNTEGQAPQFTPIRSVKRSVDEYIEKLKQKQQNNKYTIKPLNMNLRAKVNTAQTSRLHKIMQSDQMTDSINVFKLKYSTENIFKQEPFLQGQNKKQRKFRSTFVKKKESNGFYSLKGIKLNNNQLFENNNLTISKIKNQTKSKNTSKLLCLRRLKIIKPKTILLSIDFILNQHNFWQQQKIDESANKYWKILQEHSNIVWITKRQNSLKKLERYARQYGLRLDGVYKIMPNKKSQTLILSLATFEKDYVVQSQCTKSDDIEREIILINSLKVQSIQDVGFQQFYNSLPISKSLKCIVHFIQIDMNDKCRFNSPMKVLSKQKLPHPNSVNHFFSAFNKVHSANPTQYAQLYQYELDNVEQADLLTNQEMMQRYQQMKETFVNYFGNHLKINLNKKVKIDNGQASVQYVIGDMLRRNFNIMFNYHKQSRKIHQKLEKINKKSQNTQLNSTNENSQNILQNNFLKPQVKITINQILKSKLTQTKKHQSSIKAFTQNNQQKKHYTSPVFLWKK